MSDFNPAAARQAVSEKMASMSFLDHLEELRRRIIWSLAFVAGGFFVCWYYAERIYGYVQVPMMEALHRHQLDRKLVYLNPTEPFNTYLKIGFISGLFLVSPLVLYQVWAFIAPGLYRHEKKYVLPFMFFSVGLFMAGGFFGYRIVYPAALDFLPRTRITAHDFAFAFATASFPNSMISPRCWTGVIRNSWVMAMEFR